jgi:Flp pilus assembly pilin Flp
MLQLFRRFETDASGATAIEYAMVAATMAFALLACLANFSDSVGTLFASVVAAF